MQWLPSVDARKEALALLLKKSVFDGLYKGFISTFGDDPTDQTCDMAMRFAQEASPDITNGIMDTIDNYLKGLIINIPAAPQASLVSPMGPVSGTVMIPDSMIMVS